MNEERVQTLMGLEERLGWHFADIALLDNALTHRSFVNENVALPCRDNERLEFLGDAVLELTVSDMLMRKFPDHAEGQLSKLRASVVNEQPLAELARRFRIGEHLLLGKGEEGSGGRMKSGPPSSSAGSSNRSSRRGNSPPFTGITKPPFRR
jgi:dsRNA-specific ribonuclease